MEMCWNWFILNDLRGAYSVVIKIAKFQRKNFKVYLLIKNETYKTAKSFLIRPSIQVNYL